MDRAHAQGHWDRPSWREQVAAAVGHALHAVLPVLREFRTRAEPAAEGPQKR
jgi:hypothetical protein